MPRGSRSKGPLSPLPWTHRHAALLRQNACQPLQAADWQATGNHDGVPSAFT
jgi:hypothetical protein